MSYAEREMAKQFLAEAKTESKTPDEEYDRISEELNRWGKAYNACYPEFYDILQARLKELRDQFLAEVYGDDLPF